MLSQEHDKEQTHQRIPRNFIFVYGLHPKQEAFHLIHYLCLSSCLAVNKPDKIILCTPQEPFGHYWDLIKQHIEIQVVSKKPQISSYQYKNASINPYRYAHHSDYIRLEQLLKHGGVYADLDTLFVNPIPEELYSHPCVLGKESDIQDPITGMPKPSLCNAVIMSQAHSNFCQQWLNGMDDAFDGTWSNHSTLLPQRLSEKYPSDIHIEPESSFFHFKSTNEGLSKLFDSDTPIPKECYSIHLWAHLWWSDKRVDFSTFDAGLVTEEFVQTTDTTYNKTARLYLPGSNLPAPIHIVQKKLKSTYLVWMRKYAQYKNTQKAKQKLAKVLSKYKNDERMAPLIHKAQRSLLFYQMCQTLGSYNNFETAILGNIILDDEYQLGSQQFKPDNVIIDVGSHLGAFSLLCHHLGSRNIFGFEADKNNYKRLKSVVKNHKGIHISPSAVFRSDIKENKLSLTHSGPQGVNSGAGNVILNGHVFTPENQQAWLLEGQAHKVKTIALDDILRQHQRVTLLKLDCEGSEFPILLTSLELGRVDEIIGEYHEVSQQLMTQLDPCAQVGRLKSYTIGLIGARLQSLGFEFTFSKMQNHIGHFHAVRKKTP